MLNKTFPFQRTVYAKIRTSTYAMQLSSMVNLILLPPNNPHPSLYSGYRSFQSFICKVRFYLKSFKIYFTLLLELSEQTNRISQNRVTDELHAFGSNS